MRPRTRPRLAAGLAALALAAGLTAAGTGTARAASGWDEIYNPYLHAQGNTLCFNDPGASTSNYTPVNLYRCYGYDPRGTRQRWVLLTEYESSAIGTLGPFYEIYNVAAGLCLTADGAAVDLETCNGSTQWVMWSEGTGPDGPVYEFTPFVFLIAHEAYCVTASNHSDSDSTPLVMEPCDATNGGALWSLG
jgi:hypothetical protein